jgi:peroxiredoxin
MKLQPGPPWFPQPSSSRSAAARQRAPGRAVLVVAVGLALATAVLTPAGGHATAPASRPRVGDKAPAFVLKSVDKNEPKALADLLKEGEGRGVVLTFLCAKCPYVAQARQPLGDLFRSFGSKVNFVGVNANQNENADDIKADAAASFPFPMLRDEGAKVADLFAAERTPEVFLIDASGIIRYHGGVAELGAALGDFTAGRPVAKAEVKAFGCTIKRKS